MSHYVKALTISKRTDKYDFSFKFILFHVVVLWLNTSHSTASWEMYVMGNDLSSDGQTGHLGMSGNFDPVQLLLNLGQSSATLGSNTLILWGVISFPERTHNKQNTCLRRHISCVSKTNKNVSVIQMLKLSVTAL